jgi:8-oxo-dGTP diphosphatase
MLPANAPVLASLALPTEYAITQAAKVGVASMLGALERRLEGGLKLLQVREPDLAEDQRRLFTQQAIGLAHRYGCRVLVKSPFPQADGLHLTAAQLMACEAKPDAPLVVASCHTRKELERACELELDFAVMGPLKATASHPDARGMGWERFAEATQGASIPVYAIGGLARADFEHAWRAGAHGLAMIRGSWA